MSQMPPEDAPGAPPATGAEPLDDARLQRGEELIGYRFVSRNLFHRALSHASLRPLGERSNERLEFLGDAVLGMVISYELFRRFPNRDEGELTKAKSALVSADSLAEAGLGLGLDELVAVGKGLRRSGELPGSLMAGALEAVFGAVYVDGGLEPAARLIISCLADRLEQVASNTLERNYKALLQQHTQRTMAITPSYLLVAEEGPDHGKHFEVVAVLAETEYGRGRGRNKKEAEQQAASETLEMLEGEAGSGAPGDGASAEPGGEGAPCANPDDLRGSS